MAKTFGFVCHFSEIFEDGSRILFRPILFRNERNSIQVVLLPKAEQHNKQKTFYKAEYALFWKCFGRKILRPPPDLPAALLTSHWKARLGPDYTASFFGLPKFRVYSSFGKPFPKRTVFYACSIVFAEPE